MIATVSLVNHPMVCQERLGVVRGNNVCLGRSPREGGGRLEAQLAGWRPLEPGVRETGAEVGGGVSFLAAKAKGEIGCLSRFPVCSKETDQSVRSWGEVFSEPS